MNNGGKARKSIISEIADNKKQHPGSWHYKNTKHWDWSAKKNAYRPKGKFMTSSKISSTAELMARKKSVPGPSNYKTIDIKVLKGPIKGSYK